MVVDYNETKEKATKVMHWNAMGLTEERKDALQIFIHENENDVCCMQLPPQVIQDNRVPRPHST